MLSNDDVMKMITDFLPVEHIEVEGDGHHFFAQIISSAFIGKSRLARHRMVKDGLAEQLSTNQLHALSITIAATPEEWAKRHQ